MQSGDRARGKDGDILVVKLGGSIVTYKDRAFAIRLRLVEHLAGLLAETRRGKGYDILVVIGGGSFGHVAVEEARRAGAPPWDTISVTSMAMYELALQVSDILVSKGLHAYIFPPHAFCKPRGLRPNCDWSIVSHSLAHGLVPLLFGDIYPLEGGGYGIVSGDDLVIEGACALGAEKAVFLTNVDGVYRDVSSRKTILFMDRALVERIVKRQNAGTWGTVDVTGGMKRKLESILVNGCKGLRIIIANAFRVKTPDDILRETGGDRTLIEL